MMPKKQAHTPTISDSDTLYNFDPLFSHLFALKYWILGLSIFLTLCILTYGFTYITPTYKASARMNMGLYEVSQIECKYEIRELEACKRRYQPKQVVMMAPDAVNQISMFSAENISNSIDAESKDDYSLGIISLADSPDEAKKSLEKIINFITSSHLELSKKIIKERSELIKTYQDNIHNLNSNQIAPLNAKIQNKLAKARRETISKEREIDMVENNKLREIDIVENNKLREIDMVENNQLPVIDKRLNELDKRLNEINALIEHIANSYAKLIFDQKNSLSSNNLEIGSKFPELEIQNKQSLIYMQNNLIQDKNKLSASIFALEIKKIKLINLSQSLKVELTNLPKRLKAELIKVLSPLKDKLKLLKDEETYLTSFANPVTLDNIKLINREISHRSKQMNEMIVLNQPNNYIHTSIAGEIISSKKQITPNLSKYAFFGFLSSLALFLFIFTLFGVFLSNNKSVK
jgi:hypothetical protein